LVRGSSKLALRMGVSSLLVGLTVVAFGTSAPEMVVSLQAGAAGMGEISLGNVIGSNIFNIAFILGLAALIRPLKVHLQVLKLDTPLMVLFSLALLFFLRDTALSRVEGIILFSSLVGYLVVTIRAARKTSPSDAVDFETELNPAKVKAGAKWVALEILFIIGGLGALVWGSDLFVDAAVKLARFLGVSEAVIGLTIVAAGTSLPELATSVVAAIKKETDIAIGNIVGSNIFNILAIAGLTSILTPLSAPGIAISDLLVMVATAVVLLPFMWTGFRLNRLEGVFLLAIYCGYSWYLWR
jgi:cation:H+ antiporter